MMKAIHYVPPVIVLAIAVAWFTVLNDPDKKRNMTGEQQAELLDRWLHSDPAAALAWIHSLPEGGKFVQIQGNHPASTFAWAQTLSDVAAKLKLTRSVYEDWFLSKLPEAAAALQTLPPGLRHQIFAEGK